MNRTAITRTEDGRQLMLAVKSGSDGAFQRLSEEYTSYIRKVISRYVKTSSMIDDLAQDVLLRVYGARNRYEPVAPFEAFLHTIIYNLCVNHVRYHRRRQAISLSSPCETGESLDATMPDHRGEAPDQDALRRERAADVREAVARLPVNQQRALMLSHFDGLSHKEVGGRVGLSVSAVKSLIWRARENLRRMLEADLAGAPSLPLATEPPPRPAAPRVLAHRRERSAA